MPVTFSIRDHDHTGFIVQNLPETMDILCETLGVTWSAIGVANREMIAGSRLLEVKVSYCHSIDDAHHIELIEAVPGTIYQSMTGAAVEFHHLGYRSTDLRFDSRRMETFGGPRESSGTAPGVPPPAKVAYHLLPGGLRVELYDDSTAVRLEGEWARLRAQLGMSSSAQPSTFSELPFST